MKIRIEPYRTWSGGARALGKAAGILRATRRQVEKHGDFTHIINWGRNERRFQASYINEPESVRAASHKKTSLEILEKEGVPTLSWTDDKVCAQDWFDNGDIIVGRRLLRANSGRGIILFDRTTSEGVPEALLYTRYEKKAAEYRVHAFDGRVIDVQIKRKRREVPNEEVNYQIRNSANGWVYCREDVQAPQAVLDAGVNAVGALGLDFGAVDIGWNDHKQEAVVYEVNTAPGLEGTTLRLYYEALLKKFPVLAGGMYRKRRQHVQS